MNRRPIVLDEEKIGPQCIPMWDFIDKVVANGFNPLTPVPPVTAWVNLGLSSSSDVITFDQNWHHLYTECKYGGPLGRRPGRAT